jgi:hypothetical protein
MTEHEPGTANLVRIEAGAGDCDDCATPITLRKFIVEFPDGTRKTLGRRCATKATGWTLAQMKDAEGAEIRAAAEATYAARYDRLVAAYPIFNTVPKHLAWDIVTSDWHWREDWRWKRFAENHAATIKERRRERRV